MLKNKAPVARSPNAVDAGAWAARPRVIPLARALALLGAFTPQDQWLGHRDLVSRTGLPASTVARLAQSLVALGYLHQSLMERKFRLAPSVLALGYGTIANSAVHHSARLHMRAFAERHNVHINLSSRDRLDLIVLEACSGQQELPVLNLKVGTRIKIASSPMGWALLAALPELERYYLMESVERRMPREWPRLRRLSSAAISQTHQLGFCTSLGEWDRKLGIVATPLVVETHAPLVLACVSASSQLTRARAEREIGPRLLALAGAIRGAGAAE